MSAAHRESAARSSSRLSDQPYGAVVVTTNRRDVLFALTQDAVDYFGHGPLLLTDLCVSTHVVREGATRYLASAQFSVSE